MFRDLFRKLLPRRTPKLSPEEQRAAFQARYRHFRSLLTANNAALEMMAALAGKSADGSSYGMAFIRATATAAMVNVFKMIRDLSAMRPGRYEALEKSFSLIESRLNPLLESQTVGAAGPDFFLLEHLDAAAADQAGNKMANLAEAANLLGLRVPEGFVVTAAACRRFLAEGGLEEEAVRRLQTIDIDNLEDLYAASAAIQGRIAMAPLPVDLERELLARFDVLARGRDIEVALRSSAIGEDGAGVSFAGQYRTELGVARDFLIPAFREVVASKYSRRAIVYRRQMGFRDRDVDMAVGCLAMVDAAAGGVAYSCDPAAPSSGAVVMAAISGFAKGVVDGTAPAETFIVSREAPHRLLEQRGSDGSLRSPTAGRAILSVEQLAELAGVVLALERHFGSPQDVEWTFDRQGRLFILQSRPLTLPAGETFQREVSAREELPPPLLSGGLPGAAGVAYGPAALVRTDLDLLRFPKDAVLVVVHPLPHWAPVLSRAAAVVAETGSSTCHLATVAREYGIPALFGLEGASARLTSGLEITVDAGGRRVFAGRVDALLAAQATRPNLMAGSPVEKVMREVLALITPLNLTDPDSPYFRPSECRTLHDITRFCHEKSVLEMFRVGGETGREEHAARRLVGETVSEWFVIDLSDGLKVDAAPGHFVHIADVQSEPMLALWEGINVVPWRGPPPVDLRGFGSILFRSTRNPAMDPMVRSPMGGRNYFMISKNFCNLSVRLGYHFAMVEGFLSDLKTEGYVSFTFKGGAADRGRRALRVELIAGILKRYEFRVEVTGDALNARVERKSPEYLKERLRVLGYLTMHTRQIDMVMDGQATVERFRRQLTEEIDAMLARG